MRAVRTLAAALGAVAALGTACDDTVAPVRPEGLPASQPPPATPEAKPERRPGLDFEPAKGWHVRTTGPQVADERGDQAWASNVPFAEDEEPIGEVNHFPAGWPDRTEAALPPDGILLVAGYPLHTRNPLPSMRDVPERKLPLSIDRRPGVGIEGQDPDHAQTGVNAVVNGRYVSVRVVFGSREPTDALVREAERELRRLVVPPPPDTTRALDDFGIRMEVPEEWHRLLFRWAGAEPILHVATVPITDLYAGSSAREALRADDFFLVLSENYALASRYETVSLPVAIREDDECPTCEILDNGTSPPADHALFYRTFSVDGRRFDLYVEFGTRVPGRAGLDRVNDLLATLSIGPPDSPPSSEPPEEVEDRTVAADVPPGWVADDDPVPASTGPRVVAAYATWELPRGGECGPEPALEGLPDDGALVWVTEHADPGNSGEYLPLPPGFEIDLQTPPARWECAAAAPSRMYLFRVDGRYFEVHVALGPRAGAERVREAEALIRSLAPD